jgi:hypothetical protein
MTHHDRDDEKYRCRLAASVLPPSNFFGLCVAFSLYPFRERRRALCVFNRTCIIIVMTVSEVWDASQLMGGGTVAEQSNGSGSHGKGKGKGKGVDTNPLLWGLPGHLSEEETDVFFKFKETVEKRGGEFRETVYSFGEEEGEVWALCRWLRARKFVYDDVVKMIEEATQVRKEAKSKDFYPNPVDALGVDPGVFFAQYPQLYSGMSKLGVPIFISKPGILNVDGIECITTLDGIIKFHWHVMMHDFASRLLARKKASPEEFKRCVLVFGVSFVRFHEIRSSLTNVAHCLEEKEHACAGEHSNHFAIAFTHVPFFSLSPRRERAQVRVLLHPGSGWADHRAAIVTRLGDC